MPPTSIFFKLILGWGAERERERERIPSRLQANSAEPDAWLNLINLEIMT